MSSRNLNSSNINNLQSAWDDTLHVIQNHSLQTATPTTTTSRAPKARRYMTRQTQNNNNITASPATPTNNTNITNQGSPNVVLRPLPFYDPICELIRPTGLHSDGVIGRPNETQIEFKLTIDQADAVAMARETKNILLRFCYLDGSCEQDDVFPPDIVIAVNGCHVVLPPAITNPNRPNAPPKRPGQHVDITRLCKLSPIVQNIVTVKWYVDQTDPLKRYAIAVLIGEKVSASTLLQRIKDRGLSDPAATKKLILDSDTEVATTNLQTSLVCPLGKMRMSAPCKSVQCQHIPCFDASIYLQMNERKATWNCPICHQSAYYPDLMIDGYFMDILDNTATNVTEVTLNPDGSWNPVLKKEVPASAKNPPPEIITISDDDD